MGLKIWLKSDWNQIEKEFWRERGERTSLKKTRRKTIHSPKLEKKTAPTNPMNASNLGTAAANPPKINTITPRIKICAMLWWFFCILGETFRHKISIGIKNWRPNVHKMATPMRIWATLAGLQIRKKFGKIAFLGKKINEFKQFLTFHPLVGCW